MKEPVRYSRKLMKDICDQLAEGKKSLRKICEADGYPVPSAVLQWVMTDKDGCAEQYVRAREIQASVMVDDLLTISDDDSGDLLFEKDDGTRVMNKEFVARSRLRFDARRWYISKVLPKVYGDKLDLNHAGKVDVNLTGAALLLQRAKLEASQGNDEDETPEEVSKIPDPG